ncbi:photosynthetic complex putative assembly protein PuhB [Erythrobacter sp. LQ02-29]|uniref:photosynthetic complex putative assembly protein PuhB n=1 Tax=Erythrobacter sp. LQ02-29 TaxID=2920384 RepID=UPI001F4E28CE|nr:photosynthetic complex putative assembly protein PuhB [Erythrobacter sp. LQ02-29]MCP9223838.1 photosynthetic complex putative assembly protein PuhB [Erythrobacter sp. LQ02-29]
MNRTDLERQAGLDRPLPPGEKILWQGHPSPRAMGAVVFRFRFVWAYLALLVLMTVWGLRDSGWPMGQSIGLAMLAIPVGMVGLGILALIGLLMARTSTYTLTDRRIIMHIGIAYDRTISIPLSAIIDASIRPRGRKGVGDIAFVVKDVGGLHYINLWPHARAFRLTTPQPALRALPDAAMVAERIGDALFAFNTAPRTPQTAAEQTSAPASAPVREPAMQPPRKLAGVGA